MRNRLPACLLACTLLTVFGTGVAASQPQYDTPALTVTDRGLYRLTLQVTAGPSGAPNGFTVEWMTRANYDLHGGWPVNGADVVYCTFNGPSTLNLWAGSPLLGANESAYVQMGDLFDETAIDAYSNDQDVYYYDQLTDGTQYVFRAQAVGDATIGASEYSATLYTSTLVSECTQGFWKTHGPGDCHQGNNPDLWPASCFPMMLGNVAYNQAEICSILLAAAEGNGLISLAHQLITAKLNICNFSDGTPVAQTIADADALIGNLVVPPVGAGSLDPSQTSDLTETLDDYNNGLLGGVADCPTPVSNTTWGRLKVLYR